MPRLIRDSLRLGLGLGLGLGLLMLLGVACSGGVAQSADLPEPAAAAAPESEVRDLQVIALANEGFLLRSGEQGVLIDAFLSVPYAGYDALPPEVLSQLTSARPPFDGVDLALVSHEHADHLQAEPALAFLASSPDTLLATSPQALAVVWGADGVDAEGVNHQIQLPAPGESSSVERGGVQVEFLRLAHGGRFADIQNLGHVITLGGQRVLHLGDAATRSENYEAYALAERSLDVALVPYWFFLEEGGRRLMAEHIRARHVIACHVPAGERDEIARALAESDPHVVVPGRPMERWTIAAP